MPIAAELLKSVSKMKLQHAPVSVAFLTTAPAGLPRTDRALPAGCSYWKHASEGHAFYTTPEDHHNCTVGAFTHGVTLPPAKAKELEGLMGTMVQLHYITSGEIPQIPHRATPMDVVAYAPLDRAAFDPDVVIFRGNTRQIMLMSEAARSAGIFESAAAMGRPACAMIPQSMNATGGVASVGCIGNRVYTDLGDDELYFAVPGKALSKVLEQLAVIQDANTALESFHRERRATLQ